MSIVNIKLSGKAGLELLIQRNVRIFNNVHII